MSDVKELRIFS
jgi:calcium-dependent protein kinase